MYVVLGCLVRVCDVRVCNVRVCVRLRITRERGRRSQETAKKCVQMLRLVEAPSTF